MYAISRIIKNEELKEEIGVYLPLNWWEQNHSYNFYMKGNNNNATIFSMPIHKNKIVKEGNSNSLFKNYDWKFSDGDYQVEISNYNNRDLEFYQNKKNMVLKYSIYRAAVRSGSPLQYPKGLQKGYCF